MKKYVVTGCCNSVLFMDCKDIQNDEIGVHISNCPYCKSSSNIEFADDLLIKNGTYVEFNGEIGMIFENDIENSEVFSDVNYGFISKENMKNENWHNVMEFIRLGEFKIIEN